MVCDDVSHMAHFIGKLRANRFLRDSIVNNARQTAAEKFSIETNAKRCLLYMMSVMQRQLIVAIDRKCAVMLLANNSAAVSGFVSMFACLKIFASFCYG